jgi:eukaryotic-like serine/threonine-protein kinase
LEVLGRLLLQQRKWAEAEAVLRECVTIREQAGFFSRVQMFAAKSLLGASLVGQKKYADAEPILHQAYEGLKDARDQGSPKDPKHLIPVPEAARAVDATLR